MLTFGLLVATCLSAGCNQTSDTADSSRENQELSELVDTAETDVLSGNENSRLAELRSHVEKAASDTASELTAHYDLGFYLNELGKHGLDTHRDDAIASFERCLELLENGVIAPEADKTQVMAGLAFTYYTDWSNTPPHDPSREAKGRVAWDKFNMVADLYRTEHFWLGLMVTNHNRAMVAEGLGEINSAIEYMEEAVRLDEQHGPESYREFNRDYLAMLRSMVDEYDGEPSDEPKSR